MSLLNGRPAACAQVNGPGLRCSHLQKKDEQPLSELEMKHGLQKIAETLAFLHGSCKRVHCNLSPQSIFIAADGTWKLAGLGLSQPASEGQPRLPSTLSVALTRLMLHASCAGHMLAVLVSRVTAHGTLDCHARTRPSASCMQMTFPD